MSIPDTESFVAYVSIASNLVKYVVAILFPEPSLVARATAVLPSNVVISLPESNDVISFFTNVTVPICSPEVHTTFVPTDLLPTAFTITAASAGVANVAPISANKPTLIIQHFLNTLRYCAVKSPIADLEYFMNYSPYFYYNKLTSAALYSTTLLGSLAPNFLYCK